MRLILKHDGLALAATMLVLALVTASAAIAAEDPPPPLTIPVRGPWPEPKLTPHISSALVRQAAGRLRREYAASAPF